MYRTELYLSGSMATETVVLHTPFSSQSPKLIRLYMTYTYKYYPWLISWFQYRCESHAKDKREPHTMTSLLLLACYALLWNDTSSLAQATVAAARQVCTIGTGRI